VRTCVGCQKQDDADAMIRLVLDGNGGVAVDLAGGAFGRGAWSHPVADCLVRSVRGGMKRALKSDVRVDPAELCAAVRAAGERRVEALLGAARGAKKLAVGSDASKAACEESNAHLLIVARDARAAATEGWVMAAVKQGRAVAWGEKERLGRVLARPDTAVVAVMDQGFAKALARAVALAALRDPAGVPSIVEHAFSEVR